MKNLAIPGSLSLLLFLGTSCKKNELGGKAVISGTVVHHEVSIPGARVFVKLGVKEFPGADTTKYDHRIVSDASGKFSFDAYKGDYFLYGYGYDKDIKAIVTGGTSVSVKRTEKKEISLPVTE